MDGPFELEFKVLGSFEARTRSGARIEFSNRKVAQLSAYLARRPGVPYDRIALASAIWSDGDVDAGLASLRNALALLKRNLAAVSESDRFLEADRVQVAFAGALVSSDFAEFNAHLARAKRSVSLEDRVCHLVRVVALDSGPFMAGMDATWIDQDRALHARASVEAVNLLVEAYLDQESLAEAAQVALDSFERDQESEPKLQLAIEVLGRVGRGGEAVALFRQFSKRLREQLGVAPSAKTVSLAREAKARARVLREAPATNVPSIRPPLFGREDVLSEALKAVSPGSTQARVLTFVGTGGIGKTRLAVETANKALAQFDNAVWIVELSSILEPEDVIGQVLQALSPESDEAPNLEALAGILGGRPCLVVLDNLEQIHAGLASVLQHILEACPGLKILGTSRVTIGVPTEVVMRLGPLSLPAKEETVWHSPSVQLFLDRARHVLPDFQEEDPRVLSELVARLEGLPLAICLAAANVDLLTPVQILDQLDDRFSLLVSKNPDWPHRHRRLWTCIDWSYRLHPETHSLLKRLAVFRNGWTLQTALWACPESPVASLMQTLLRSSLVFERQRLGQARFDMFESIREFVLANSDPDEIENARLDHANSVRSWLTAAKERGQAFNGGYISERAAEYENFRAAFEWGLEHEPSLALDIANSLAYYWFSRDMGHEGLEWLKTAIHAVPQSPNELLAMSYRAQSTLHVSVSEYEEGLEAMLKGLALLPEDTDPIQRARFLNSMGNALMRLGHFEEALEQFRKGEELCASVGEHKIRNSVKGNSGFVHYFAGNLDEAERVLSEVVKELDGGDNNDWLANFVHNWGLVAKAKGDYEVAEFRFARARGLIDGSDLDPAARSWLNDAAVVALRLGNTDEALNFVRRSAGGVLRSKGLEQQAECLEAAAEICESIGDVEEAVAYLAIVLRMKVHRQRSAADRSPTAAEQFESLKKRLPPEAFKKAAKRYQGLSIRDVVEEVEELARPNVQGSSTLR